jgi:hypothetical protein
MRYILRYKKFEGNDKNRSVQFLTVLYNNIDINIFLGIKIYGQIVARYQHLIP